MEEMIKPKDKFLRTQIALGLAKGKDSVDRENNVIRGYAVMTKGSVKDLRGWEIDDKTLDQVVEAGNRLKRGVKGRFGHPNMSTEAFGTYIGRSKNFRKDGDIVRADLELSDTAFDTPNGDLGTYVLDMAENEPDMFGSSVVLSDFGLERRLNTDGTPKKDKQGNELPPLLRVKKLSASDIVDEPAANNGMFATQFFNDSVKLSAEMTEFFNKFLSNEDAVSKAIDFLTRYQASQGNDNHGLNQNNQGDDVMKIDFENLTLDQLRENRPDLVNKLSQAPAAAPASPAASPAPAPAGSDKLDAAKAETERCLGIMKIVQHKDFADYREDALSAIENGLTVVEAQNKIYEKRLGCLNNNGPADPGAGDGDNLGDGSTLSNMPEGPDKWKQEYAVSADLQREFTSESRYVAYKKAEARGAINNR